MKLKQEDEENGGGGTLQPSLINIMDSKKVRQGKEGETVNEGGAHTRGR